MPGRSAWGWIVRASRDGAGGAGRDRWGGAGLCGAGRALSSCSRPDSAAEANRGGVFVDSKHWATPLLWRRGAGRGGAERDEAAGEGRPGRYGAGHARLAGCNGERQRRRGEVVWVGGEAVRRGPGRGGLARWGVPGLHKASRHSSAGGTPLFPPQEPSSEQPPSCAGWAAAVRVTESRRQKLFFC